jgi:hypothetical protein
LAVLLVVKKKQAVAEKVAQMPGKPICDAKPIPSIMETQCLWLRGLRLIFEGNSFLGYFDVTHYLNNLILCLILKIKV